MPKLKERPDKYRKLKDLLNGRMKTMELDYTHLALIVYPNLSAGRMKIARQFKSPETLTIGDLARYARALDIPADELRAAIPMR